MGTKDFNYELQHGSFFMIEPYSLFKDVKHIKLV